MKTLFNLLLIFKEQIVFSVHILVYNASNQVIFIQILIPIIKFYIFLINNVINVGIIMYEVQNFRDVKLVIIILQ